MIRRLLVANRGEIAVRLIDACRELSIGTVAIYSDADRSALHVMRADEAVRIGPAAAVDSYLKQEAIVAAAKEAKVDAVHPGYGFLSENADFAERCEAAGLTFVGPSVNAIRLMGDKVGAKRLAREAGVPVIDGYDGEVQSDERFLAEAGRIGYPVLIKAALGGGGKAMHAASRSSQLRAGLAQARREARASFGDDRLLLERLLDRPRHIEVQVLGDKFGSLIAIGERECSLQRRHQKVVEEAPSPAVSPGLRERISDFALRMARAVGYYSAGTVEFLVDGEGSAYFLEMNTRLQVEHAVTEAVYDVDLVRAQIEVATGRRLQISQDQIVPRGHAIECRVYAEDAASGFLPSTGNILSLRLPEGVGIRNDAGVTDGDDVSPYYDPMLAKLTVHATDRAVAIERMRRALSEYTVLGVTTNLQLLQAVMDDRAFQRGQIDIGFLERRLSRLVLVEPPPASVYFAATAAELSSSRVVGPAASMLEQLGAWRLGSQDLRYPWESGGRSCVVQASRRPSEPDGWRLTDGETEFRGQIERSAGSISLRSATRVERFDVARDGRHWWVGREGKTWRLTRPGPLSLADFHETSSAGGARGLSAPMPGVVARLNVREGEHVEAHQVLLVLEAMKMEHAIEAPAAGVVRRLYYNAGDLVAAGSKLVDLE